MELTQERLKEVLHYEPETGIFTRVKPKQGCMVGGVAIYLAKDGYMRIIIDSRGYFTHRLAFLFMEGEFPAVGLQIDHINQVKYDNRWSNLRTIGANLIVNGK